MTNAFQKWAKAYAARYGFTVTPKGNWVELVFCGGEPIECMTVAAVRKACGEQE
jgi:D-tyrosyl-tRNA(Tyr) deacylase